MALSQSAKAQTDRIPEIRNNYGTLGLIDMPSARVAPDGELAIGASVMRNIQHYNFDFEVLPWLEASFRYSGIDHFNDGIPIYYDRAFGLKAHLLEESDLLPAVALGVNDLVGTGIYASEYLAATKRIGNFETTVGIGWGRLATANTFKNPLTLLSKKFETRTGLGLNTPGSSALNEVFRGPNAGFFGGITWNTPIKGVSLIGELSSDAYVQETTMGTPTDRKAFIPRSQFNIGADYQFSDTASVGLYWMYGTSLGASISLQLDPVRDPYTQRMGPTMPEPRIRTPDEQQHALALLLNMHDGASRFTTVTLSTKGEMVDALWRAQNGITDISVSGSTLHVALAGGNVHAACQNIANIVSSYGAQFAIVTVASGRQSARCLPPRSVMGWRTGLHDDPAAGALENLIATPAEPILIDARQPVALTTKQTVAAIKADAAKQQLTVLAVTFGTSEATVYYSNTRYFVESAALERLTRVMMKDAPDGVEVFRFIAVSGSTPMRQFEVLRAPAERAFDQTGEFDHATLITASAAPMSNPGLRAEERKDFPLFNWSVFPQFRQQFFDVNNPFAVQFLAAGQASVELWPGFSLLGEGELNIYDNFNVNTPPSSVLPHVRTDFTQFFTHGANGIGDLEANYRFRLAPELFALARVGYLESMYAGAGGELLWAPSGQRWTLGADVYDVRERDFNRLFGLQPYHVVTGHVSVHYASPWYGLNFEVRAGRYLAGDYGVTLQATRRFASGIEIGAFMTKTNVSAAQFGEGSFDKGIIVRFPLGWIAPINTQSEYFLKLRPVQRDGGQPLDNDEALYYQTYRTSDSEMQLHDPDGSD